MKAKLIHLWEVVAGAILSLLGFGGCNSLMGIRDVKAEYGMPHASYKLVGEVLSEDGTPVPGIKVTYRHDFDENNFFEEDTYSDEAGKVSFDSRDFHAEPSDISVRLEDVDGEENGSFDPLVLQGNDLSISLKEGSKKGWNRGNYTVSFAARLRRSMIDMPAEYGMPHADYKVFGSVKDPQGNPVPGIQVLSRLWQINEDGQEFEGTYLGMVQTDATGAFSMDGSQWPANAVKVSFEDVDGPSNGGEFAAQDVTAKFTQTQEADGRWFEGGFEARVDVTLKKK